MSKRLFLQIWKHFSKIRFFIGALIIFHSSNRQLFWLAKLPTEFLRVLNIYFSLEFCKKIHTCLKFSCQKCYCWVKVSNLLKFYFNPMCVSKFLSNSEFTRNGIKWNFFTKHFVPINYPIAGIGCIPENDWKNRIQSDKTKSEKKRCRVNNRTKLTV